MNVEPKRIELINKILNIINEKESRVDVSKWAVDIFEHDSLRIKDPLVLKYIKILGAVDLPSTDRDYLYTVDDLKDWVNDLING